MKSAFEMAMEGLLELEGGYQLHTVAGDRGGMTYAGISRRNWTDWEGWRVIDSGGRPQQAMVYRFYRRHFWDSNNLDQVANECGPHIAAVLFWGVVNMGKVAVKLAQSVAGVKQDGVIGPVTIQGIRRVPCFIEGYSLLRINRYREIVNRDRSQVKFFRGWINRVYREIELAQAVYKEAQGAGQ